MVYRPRGLYESDSSPCDVNKGKFEDNEGVNKVVGTLKTNVAYAMHKLVMSTLYAGN